DDGHQSLDERDQSGIVDGAAHLADLEQLTGAVNDTAYGANVGTASGENFQSDQIIGPKLVFLQIGYLRAIRVHGSVHEGLSRGAILKFFHRQKNRSFPELHGTNATPDLFVFR